MTKVDPPCSAQPMLAGVQAYQPQVADRSEWHPVRGLQMHVRRWRTDGADPAPLVMLHGWMDCSASYQFIVDHLHGAWELFAPDWRGFGLSDRTPADTYWFPDYLGDLDQLLDRIAPGQPVNLLAHSMGGNIAMMYAGVRPERVRRVINLEGLGLRAIRPAQAPRRYQRWLDELRRDTPRSGRPYPSLAAVAERLMQSNPRLDGSRALFLAAHWSRLREDGQREMLGDPVHKLVNPVLYRVPEVLACWRSVKADVLWVMAAEQPPGQWFMENGALERRLRAIRSLRRVAVADAGHMLHHDQPGRIASLIEEFLR